MKLGVLCVAEIMPMTVGKARQFLGGIDDYRIVRDVAEEIMGSIIQQARKSERRIILNTYPNAQPLPGRLQRLFNAGR